MKPSRRVAVALGTAGAIALAAASGLPAQGATASNWHVVFTRHYGPAADFSGYLTGLARSRGDAWAFGSSDLSGSTAGTPVAEHWNGAAWRGSALPAGLTDEVLAASADSASDVWAVTHLSGYVLHWNGTSWSVSLHVNPNGAQFTGVTAVSPANVWVFGGGGFTGGLGTWHFNGSRWTHVTSATGLEEASALSASSIWAIGSVAAPDDSIWRYNGATWRQLTAAALKGLSFRDILAKSATSVWVAATIATNSRKSYLVHFNGTQWVKLLLPWAVTPSRIAPDGHGGIWMSTFGSTGTSWIAHLSATGQWSRTMIGSTTTASLFDPVLIPGTTSMWGFGSVDGTTGSSAAIWSR
jgi:hypothetical protein